MIGQTVGSYEILDKLGEGGMGAVYKALDTRLGRTVALKVLPAEVAGDEERRQRFLREAQSASRLNHPNIVTIYDVAHVGGTYFITMEYVAGKTLEVSIPPQGFDSGVALPIARQLASALRAAHEAGIIHRDLKPANIMLVPDGTPKILDFGLAKLIATENVDATAATMTSAGTLAGMVMGTAGYMSPEQASGLPLDARSDIFAFGVVVYEMLSGQKPFPGATALARVAGVLYAEPPPLRVSAALGGLVLRCMSKDPGNRFSSMAEVQTALNRVGPAGPPAIRLSNAVPSVAVLPFVNMNHEPDSEFFCDGLTEELINALCQLKNLRVVSRSTVFQFKGKHEDTRTLCERLKVETALEGTVRKAGTRLRITAHLVSASDGCHIWSQRFDREMADIFEVQDEVTRAIIDRLRVRIPGATQPNAPRLLPEDPEAWAFYLKGRYYQRWATQEGLQKGLACFEEAILKDPGHARAYAGIADIYSFMSIVGAAPPNDLMPKSKAAAMKALDLDDSLAEASSALGLVHLWYEWDWAAAEARLRRAAELSPGNPDVHTNLALLLTRLGRPEEALAVARRALEIDPLGVHGAFGVADALFLGRFPLDDLIAECRKMLDLVPQALWPHWYLIDALVENRDFAAVPDAVRLARARAAGEPISEGIFGWAYAQCGQPEDARAILASLKARRNGGFCPAVPIAWIHLGLGELKEALTWLETAYAERDPLMAMVFVNRTHDCLRGDPRFQDLLDRMNFPAI